MSENNSIKQPQPIKEAETILTKHDIKEKVYRWGLRNGKLPVFSTYEEEIQHFGKSLSEFNKAERKYYSKYMEWLEYAFEVQPTAYVGL